MNPKIFGVFATALNAKQAASPDLPGIVENWRTITKRIVIVVDSGVKVPDIKGVRYERISAAVPMLHHVLNAALKAAEHSAPIVLADPDVVFGGNIVDLFKIVEKRQFQSTWMATGNGVALADFTAVEGPLVEGRLSMFAAPLNIWTFAARKLTMPVRFENPLWGGYLGTWASTAVQRDRYFDITGLGTLAYVPFPDNKTDNLEGFGKLTLNPPLRTYVLRSA